MEACIINKHMKQLLFFLSCFYTVTVYAQDNDPLNHFEKWTTEYLKGGTLICNETSNGELHYDFTNYQFNTSEWDLFNATVGSSGDCQRFSGGELLEGGCNALPGEFVPGTATYFNDQIGYKLPKFPGNEPPGYIPETDQNIILSPEGLYLKLRKLDDPIEMHCPYIANGDAVMCEYSGAFLNSHDAIGMGTLEIKFETFLPNMAGSQMWPAFWLWHHDEIDLIDKARTAVIGEGYNTGTAFPHQMNVLSTLKMVWTPFKITFYRDEVKFFEVFKYYKYDQNNSNLGGLDVECGEAIPTGSYKVNPAFPEADGHFSDPAGRFFHINLSLAYDFWYCPDELTDPDNSKILIQDVRYTPSVYENLHLVDSCNYNLVCPRGSTNCHNLGSFVYPPNNVSLMNPMEVEDWDAVQANIISSTPTQVCVQPYLGTTFYSITGTAVDQVNSVEYPLYQTFNQPSPPTVKLFVDNSPPAQKQFIYIDPNGYCQDDITVTSIPSDAFEGGVPFPRLINGNIAYKLLPGVNLRCLTITYPEPCTGNMISTTTVFPCDEPLKGSIKETGTLGAKQLKTVNYIDYDYFTIMASFPSGFTYQWQKIAGNGILYPSISNTIEGYTTDQMLIRVTLTSECGYSFYYDIQIYRAEYERGISIKPNPAVDQIIIQNLAEPENAASGLQDRSSKPAPGIQSVRVLNQLGNVLLEKHHDSTQSAVQLNISGLKPGTFLIEVYDENGRRTTKPFVKI